jgi:hypothetical protein
MRRYLPALTVAALLAGAGALQAQSATMRTPSAPVNNSGHPADTMTTPGSHDPSDDTKAAKRGSDQTTRQPATTRHDTTASTQRPTRVDRARFEATKALNLLEASGYTGIQDFRRQGDRFEAVAHHDGVQQRVMVDPDTRMIQRAS